jgi:hypothetical protein
MEKSLEAVLQETVEKLQAENATLKAENETLTAVNEELTAKVEELSAPKTIAEAVEEKKPEAKIPDETFSVDKVNYRFTTPVFFFDNKRITAESALTDQALLKKLVKLKSGIIQQA